jgi:hypothetical protein
MFRGAKYTILNKNQSNQFSVLVNMVELIKHLYTVCKWSNITIKHVVLSLVRYFLEKSVLNFVIDEVTYQPVHLMSAEILVL